MKRVVLTTATLALLAAMPAMAQDMSGPGRHGLQKHHQRHDSDHRGMRHGFESMDTDGDGVVSEQEYRAAHRDKAHQKRSFQDMDNDGDSVLTREEYMELYGKDVELGPTRESGTTGGVAPIEEPAIPEDEAPR